MNVDKTIRQIEISNVFLHQKPKIASSLNVTIPKTYIMYRRYYMAGTPVLVTADPDMAREIFIKQFDKFEERRVNMSSGEGGAEFK